MASFVPNDPNIYPPKDKDTGTWNIIPKLGSVIPFGYRQDPEDDGILIPIPEQLELLEQAKKHLKKYGSRAVAAWLSENSGRSISHAGLLQRVKVEKKRARQAHSYELFAKRLEKAYEKAKKIREQRIGARVSETSGD